MRRIAFYLSKIFKVSKTKFLKPIDHLVSWWCFYSNGVEFTSFKNQGWPKLNVSRQGTLKIGQNFRSNNREMANPIGRFHPCSLVVTGKGVLIIGNNVGMSSTAIVCQQRIEIGDNVNLGGGVVIYDTNFHSLDPAHRRNRNLDNEYTQTAPVKIGDDVFVGAHSTILKGVMIGDGAVIGACSVVTRSIPSNEIWAGNPASFIKPRVI